MYGLLHIFNENCKAQRVSKNVKDKLRSQNEYMGDLPDFFYFLKTKVIFKNHLIKSNHILIWKNIVDTYGALILHLFKMPLFWQPK